MRAKAADANQRIIMKNCRQIPGVSIVSIHTLGKGIPDALMGYKGKNFLLEIKDGELTKSRKKLTPDEQKFHKNWKGQVCIIESFDDVLDIILKENSLMNTNKN